MKLYKYALVFLFKKKSAKIFGLFDLYQNRTDSRYLKGSSTTVILKDLFFVLKVLERK